MFFAITSGLALAQQVPTYGFDPHQPFIDHDATARLGKPGMKIVTAYVAVGTRLDTVMSFTLGDIALRDENDKPIVSTNVAPVWKPPLPNQAIAPQAIIGGYVSWEVPYYKCLGKRPGRWDGCSSLPCRTADKRGSAHRGQVEPVATKTASAILARFGRLRLIWHLH